MLYNQPNQLLDSDADNKVADADLALQALGGDHVAFGYLTTTITVSDEDRTRVEDKIRQVERITGGLYALLAAGEIEIVKVGAATLIVVESIRAFVDRERCRATDR